MGSEGVTVSHTLHITCRPKHTEPAILGHLPTLTSRRQQKRNLNSGSLHHPAAVWLLSKAFCGVGPGILPNYLCLTVKGPEGQMNHSRECTSEVTARLDLWPRQSCWVESLCKPGKRGPEDPRWQQSEHSWGLPSLMKSLARDL